MGLHGKICLCLNIGLSSKSRLNHLSSHIHNFGYVRHMGLQLHAQLDKSCIFLKILHWGVLPFVKY